MFGGDYDPPDPKQSCMQVLIDEETVESIKENIESASIDSEKAGMTDNVLKKMILTYYKTLATVDTIIYIPINEYEKISDDKVKIDDKTISIIGDKDSVDDTIEDIQESSENFVYFWGAYQSNITRDDTSFGEKGQLYVGTMGTVVVLNDAEEKLIYYDQETLADIVSEFKESVNDEDRKGYIESFKDTFKSIYTVSEGGVGSVAAITYSLNDANKENLDCFNVKVLDYRDEVSNYVMPVELMVDFLNITASPDFIDAISELVNDSEIKIRINQTSDIVETTYNKSITLNGIEDEIIRDDEGNETSVLNYNGTTYTQSAEYVDTAETTDYVLTLKSVKCWYCTAEFNTEDQTYVGYVDEDGNEQSDECEIDITDEFEIDTPSEIPVSEWQAYLWNIDNLSQKDISEKLFLVANCKLTSFTFLSGGGTLIPKYDSISKNASKKVKHTIREWEQTTSTFEDNTQPFIDLLEEEYDDLYKSNIKAVPGDLLCNADEMFFQLLEQSAYTSKYLNVMKYILYMYSGIDYGVTDFSQLDIFYLKDFRSTGSSNSGLLKQYIRYWENAGGAPTSSDGKNYIIETDGMGHPTVGFGVDIENSGYKYLFEEAGYSTDIDGEVPIEFVDAIEDMIRNGKQQEIEAMLSGVELEGYQMAALISRAYNCGTAGAVSTLRGSLNMNFKDSYTEYWNQETDDLFEEKNNNANFNHKLYTEYMCKPVTSKGEYMAGLERRRKSEWVLFQTGYYDVLMEWYTEGGTIIECAEAIHTYMEENNYTYCVYGNNRCEECPQYRKSCGLNTTFEKSKNGYHNTCCATFVSWVLQEAGYITEEEHTNGADSLAKVLERKGWKRISYSDLEPGDILYYSGHIEIYAGDGTVYNAGSGSDIRNPAPATKDVSGIITGYRAPN